nr:hypothetical protein [Tanacetum cinerariifolium]
ILPRRQGRAAPAVAQVAVLAHVVGAGVVGSVQHHVAVEGIHILPFIEAHEPARVAVLAAVGARGAVEAQRGARRFFGVGKAPGAQVARALAVGYQAAVQHLALREVNYPEALGGIGQVHVGHGQPAALLDAAAGVQREVAH